MFDTGVAYVIPFLWKDMYLFDKKNYLVMILIIWIILFYFVLMNGTVK